MTKPSIRVRPVLFLTLFCMVWVTRLVASPFTDPPKAAFFGHLLVGTIARLAIWCLLPAFWIVVVERCTMVSALHPVERRSVRLAWVAAGLIAALLVVGMRLTRGHWFLIPSGHSTLEYISFIIAVGLLAFGEEFTFWGVFLSGLVRSGLQFWIANALVAIAFALSHWPSWILFGGISPIDVATATIRLFVSGLAMGGLVRIEGGLVTAITVHTLNDALVGTLLSSH